MIIIETIEKIIRAVLTYIRVFYYRIRLGKGITVGGPIKVFGNRRNIILKGRVGVNSFCVLGARDDGKIIIGDNVSISPGSVVISYGLDTAVLDSKRPHKSSGDIILEDNVWICSNATVTGGVRIGKNSVVAAGAVVSSDVPDNCVVAGVPAKVVKRLK